MPDTPRPAIWNSSGAAASASRAAASAHSRNPCGAISAPVGTGVQASGAWPWAISSPSGVTTAALHDVVPRSSPSSSSRLTGATLAAGRPWGRPAARVSAGRLVEVRPGSRPALSLVIETDSVPIFSVVGLPSSALNACSTPCEPMSAGCCAISAWTVPSSRSLTCFGPASKPTILTFAPDSRTPLAAPSAENRFVPKIPFRSGFFCSAALVLAAASSGLLLEYSRPT